MYSTENLHDITKSKSSGMVGCKYAGYYLVQSFGMYHKIVYMLQNILEGRKESNLTFL
jgi:hypothetical protein